MQPIPPGTRVEEHARLPFTILPIIRQAQEAYGQALPQLLRERPGQWVAFDGSRPIGFAGSKTELYQTCLQQGYPRGQFLVRCIEPEPGVEILRSPEGG
jgi:hypothetical protein